MLTLLNFSHPLSDEGREALKNLAGDVEITEINVPCQIDLGKPLEAEVTRLVHEAFFRVNTPLDVDMVIPPSLSYAAALLPLVWARLAGTWTANIVVVSKVPDSLPPRFVPSQIVPAQMVRYQYDM